jgi:UDP-GlcNAc:undecaprenyl-phosphate GlcNAc-1-phosphate transferase
MKAVPEAQALAAFLVALVGTTIVAGPIRSLAMRLDFYDYPVGYKQHLRPTPYLGGVAVMMGLAAGCLFSGAVSVHVAFMLVGALGLLVVGTIDDHRGLGITPRVGAQLAAAMVLWFSGVRWEVGGELISLSLTLFWVVGVTNAFNLMDNLDGAASTVAATCAAGAGVLAIGQGDTALGALSLAISGACAGFLRLNLAKPARMFLGDGGSTPIGFLVAAIVMDCSPGPPGLAGFLALVPLAALPIFDTALVMVSRYRHHRAVFSGGRDHLTHRLLPVLGSERSVACALGLVQAVLAGLAVVLNELEMTAVIAASFAYVAVGIGAIALLDSPPLTSAQTAEKRIAETI